VEKDLMKDINDESFQHKYLWGYIVWCSAQCPRRGSAELGEPKVGDFDMTIDIQENIFWLQVPVNDIETVQVV
jgi:hypothetical protein